MKVARLYSPTVLSTRRSAPIAEAAAAMRRFNVGCLLVMEDGDGGLVGIVTDRDLALQGFASEATHVGAFMTPVLATVHLESDVHEALHVMRAHGVRRLVVTDSRGEVRGVLSIDDIVDGLSADLAAAAAVLKGGIDTQASGLGDVKVGG